MSKQEAEVAFSAGNAAFVDEEYTLAIEVSSCQFSKFNPSLCQHSPCDWRWIPMGV
jgi:hypothetical protein